MDNAPLVYSTALAALALGGCATGRYIEDYCAARTDCLGGGQGDQAACEQEMWERASFGQGDGCGKEFDVYLACLSEESACLDGAYGSEACDRESADYWDCWLWSGCG